MSWYRHTYARATDKDLSGNERKRYGDGKLIAVPSTSEMLTEGIRLL
jgi:hypothetical protein